ncbi:MAG: hypothetical protein LBM97_01550, partial [Candidatus Nomurabacteria bacterium]|nr:hypothetical protein [Candidatus Nomurabacteria bacterium]
IFGTLTVLFFTQKGTYDAFARDDKRKISLNSIYYNLEMVFYQANGYYPETLDLDTLPTLNPELLVDPYGRIINTDDSDFRYEPADCRDGKCYEYQLKSRLEKEDELTKYSIGENR